MALNAEQRTRIQEEFRIPVDSFHPRTYWIVSLDYESEMPTDQELRQLRSFCEFLVRKYYTEGYHRRLLEAMPFAACAGHNTTIFRKGSDDGWGYRRYTWQVGPPYVPNRMTRDYTPSSLVAVLERCESLLPEEWQRWMREHPDMFPAS